MDVYLMVWVQMMTPWSGIQPWAISRSELFTDKTVCESKLLEKEKDSGVTLAIRCKKIHLPGVYAIPRHSL